MTWLVYMYTYTYPLCINCVKVKVAQSCLTLWDWMSKFCPTLWILQARILDHSSILSHSLLQGTWMDLEIIILLKKPDGGRQIWYDLYVETKKQTNKWTYYKTETLRHRKRIVTKGESNFPDDSGGKRPACNARNLSLIPGLGRYPGEGNGSPFQYSGLENPMDRGTW